MLLKKKILQSFLNFELAFELLVCHELDYLKNNTWFDSSNYLNEQTLHIKATEQVGHKSQ